MYTSFHIVVVVWLALECSEAWALASPSTHGLQRIGEGHDFEIFHPKTTYETFGIQGLGHALSRRADVTVDEAAISFLANRLGITEDSIRFRSGHSAETAKHAYLQQQHEGIPFANAVASISFNHKNNVVAFGSNFVKPLTVASSTPKLSQEAAIRAAEAALDGQHNVWPVSLEYVIQSDRTAVLTYVVQVQNESNHLWSEAFIDAHSGRLVSVTDFVAQATYRVVAVTKHDAYDGLDTLVNPEDLSASPYGWLSINNKTQFTNTTGNNVVASMPGYGPAPQSSPSQFLWNYSLAEDARADNEQKNAAIVNAFYLSNTVHDVTYRYGFTEASFNFQTTNIRAGGTANDPINVNVDNGTTELNAYFTAPPDGQPGRLDLLNWPSLFNGNPLHDGAFENDLVIHENGHGVSQRMTGGGTTRCLQTVESAGLGEGWSDALADWFNQNSSTVHDFTFGGKYFGFVAREYTYSVNFTVNPQNYSWAGTSTEPHIMGEPWAEILHVVYAALVTVHGYDTSARTNPASTAGNAIWLHLFIDGLALQPCNPTFVNARDAWIQADANRYSGANKCTLWKAFASRGLGVNAANFKDDFTAPTGC